MHKLAVLRERDALNARESGGIAQCFTKQITANRAAMQAGMHIVYWLAESEVALFTKFESLKELCIDLGAEVLWDLEKGKNAKYSSNRIRDEWLHVIVSVIRDDVKENLRKCLSMGLMCDEYADV